MGTPALETAGKVLFPALAEHWANLKTMTQVYAA